MEIGLTQIAFIGIGLIFTFFGLSFYKSFIQVFGFAVGAGYGIYLFSVFHDAVEWEPIIIYLVAGLLILVLGTVGTFITRFANAILFFLAGGLIGVVLGKIVGSAGSLTEASHIAGQAAGEIVEQVETRDFMSIIKPEGSDLIWFLGGGFLFLLSIDILLIIVFAILGAGLIWYAVAPMNLMNPDWVIPGVVGLLGLLTQEAFRRKVRERDGIPAKIRHEQKKKK